MDRSKQSGNTGFNKVIRATIAGMIIGCALCGILLWIAAVFFVKSGNLPIGILSVAVVVLSGISTFFGAYFAIRISKSNGMLVGAVTGTLVFLITVIIGAIFSNSTTAAEVLSRATVMISAGCIGGIIAVNKKSGRR